MESKIYLKKEAMDQTYSERQVTLTNLTLDRAASVLTEIWLPKAKVLVLPLR